MRSSQLVLNHFRDGFDAVHLELKSHTHNAKSLDASICYHSLAKPSNNLKRVMRSLCHFPDTVVLQSVLDPGFSLGKIEDIWLINDALLTPTHITKTKLPSY